MDWFPVNFPLNQSIDISIKITEVTLVDSLRVVSHVRGEHARLIFFHFNILAGKRGSGAAPVGLMFPGTFEGLFELYTKHSGKTG